MIVVDSSALLALLLGEARAADVAAALEGDPEPLLPAPTLVEASIVAEARFGAEGALALQQIIREAGIVVPPFDEADAAEAVDAWRRFGKGRHRAGLNLGDCFAFATAARLGVPLLFVGEDFARTGITSALPS